MGVCTGEWIFIRQWVKNLFPCVTCVVQLILLFNMIAATWTSAQNKLAHF